MSGIYIHIPFCKTKCYYCDFHTSASYKYKNQYIDAIIKEIDLKKDFISDKNVETIYFGGGTPSTISVDDINKIITKIKNAFLLSKNPEITIEANPDDLSIEYLKDLKNTEVNRLSIGIQSFDNNQLQFMNRRHDSETAKTAIANAKKIGFTNISVDLIYGLPNTNLDFLKHEIEQILLLDIQHISAYHLTIEEKTVFKKYQEKGKIKEISDTNSREQYLYLSKTFEEKGFEHYEISNFAKKTFISKHNSSYWHNKQYLGLGSSAHSYNLKQRMWNVSNIKKYLEGTANNTLYFETEELSKKDKFNDYLLTGLRTKWGVDIGFISNNLGECYKAYFLENVNKMTEQKLLRIQNNVVLLQKTRWFISDSLILDLFLDEEI